VRKARRPARLELEPLSWPVREFCLVRSRLSREGAQYQRLRRWPAGSETEVVAS
jgi:2'-5' RNA ligase